MSIENTLSKTAIERKEKEVEMQHIISALDAADIAVERVVDNGTLAYMITEGELEGRFITLKVVLTKEFDAETGKGFDMDDAIALYHEKVEARAKAQAEKAEKAEKASKKASKQSSKSDE